MEHTLCVLTLVYCLVTFTHSQPYVCNEYCSAITTCDMENNCTVSGVAQACESCAFLSPDRSECRFCLENCDECDDATTCTDCVTGFYLSADKTSCIVYPPNCAAVNTTDGTCRTCAYGYGPTTQKFCERCAENCASCTIKGAGKCDNCFQGYTRSDDFSMCQACAENCVACHISGPDKCDKCMRGYVLEDMKCRKRDCRHGCLCDTDDTERCDAAAKGYIRVTSVYTGMPFALKCAENCDECSLPGSCDPNKCKPGYAYNIKKDICVFSTASFYRLSSAAVGAALFLYFMA